MNHHKNNKGKFILATALIATVGLAAPAVASTITPETHTVTLTVDGKSTTHTTEASTVEGLLQEARVALEAQDRLSPTASTPLEGLEAVNLVKAKNLRLTVGTAKPITKRLAVLTVDEALRASGTRVGAHDILNMPRSAAVAENSSIVVKRVTFKNRAVNSKIKYKTKIKKTAKLYRGEKKVSVKGKNGNRRTVYRDQFVNGKKVASKKTSSKITKKARTHVVLKGTAKRPALSGVWKALAQCESGGNPRIVSSNGLYHGLFQFSVGTWHSVGGKGLPSQASVGEQLKRAKILQARSGWGQWPHCSRVIGVR